MELEKRSVEIKAPHKVTSQKIVRYFSHVFMGNGHNGLRKLALKHGIKISDLEPGEYVLFMNSRFTALKMFAPGNIVAHYKSPHGRIDPRVIALIPRYFNGSKIDIDGALREALLKDMERTN